MYAVIKAGGKQQKVKAGDVIEVELMKGHDHGESMMFTPILVVDDDGKTHYGKDLGKAVVRAKLVGEEKGDKVKIFKYRPKTGYSRRQGHRQMYTLIEIQDVSLTGPRAAVKARSRKKAEPTPEAVVGDVPTARDVEGSAGEQPPVPGSEGGTGSAESQGPVPTDKVEGASRSGEGSEA